MTEVLFREEVFAVQGAIFEVNKEMGAGFLESVYQECLAIEFGKRSIPFTPHRSLALKYKGEALTQTYQPDFICFDQIIVELKACDSISSAHRAQILNYLKATGLRLGLLVNFGTHPKAQIERFAL
jgi:GxxExxY protein